MKKIILASLFFCLAITTVLAQSTTNIAAPNSNGFSNNPVSSFDVNSDGTILNNSASNGTAQLGGTAVTGNANITAGSEASLILLQITGSSGSDLDGTIEVFGAKARIIIANPNGISCDGCGFINTNRVDLVTGSNYNVNTNTFGSITATDITVEENALDVSNVDVLNIQTGADFINEGDINADSLTVTAGDQFFNRYSATINADNFSVTAGDDFANHTNATINADNFNVTAEVDFFNDADSTIHADNFSVTAGNQFFNRNSSTIHADNFSVTVLRGDFANNTNSTINADNFNVTAGVDFFNDADSTIHADNFSVTAVDQFVNRYSSTINANDYFSVTVEYQFFNQNISRINTNDFSVTVLRDDFANHTNATINANNFNVTAEVTFSMILVQKSIQITLVLQ